MKNVLCAALACLSFPMPSSAATQPALASLAALERAGARILAREESIGVGFAWLTDKEQERISRLAHEAGSCAGFEVLPAKSLASDGAAGALQALVAHARRDRLYTLTSRKASGAPERNPQVAAALAELKEENIQATVKWLSAFPSRYGRLPDPNQHVVQLEERIKSMLSGYKGPWSVEQVAHESTRQRSLRVRLEGKARPSEIVVMGGHLDSINHSGGSAAPGADDNASGSATLLEALRVLALSAPFERSVEVFFYAAEETGLQGSAEIAAQYKGAGRDVVAALQLDMTMFPGSGELVIGNTEDFTSAWLRESLVAWNELYIGARLLKDSCGYACSDHASWYRQGYPTLMPFESHTDQMNRAIHTPRDVIGSGSSFTHAVAFAKIAVVLAMDLGNSTARQPY